MTAMRVGHDDPSKPGAGSQEYPSGGAYRNPASSYQTATPQQLQAAGITPVVINDRPMVRQKSSTLNSFPVYAASNTYPDQDLVGQNRPYNYDDMRVPGQQSRGEAPYVNTSSYAKASSTAYHQNAMPNRGGPPQINSVEVRTISRRYLCFAIFYSVLKFVLSLVPIHNTGCQGDDQTSHVDVGT